jgi:hypothetical protein
MSTQQIKISFDFDVGQAILRDEPAASMEDQLRSRCRGLECTRARKCVCGKNNHLYWKYVKPLYAKYDDQKIIDAKIKEIAQKLEKELKRSTSRSSSGIKKRRD